MSYVLLLIVLSAVTYRVGRFIILDTLIDEPRNRVLSWLEMRPNALTSKIHELLGCPFCITIWISAAAVAITDIWFASVPLPVWTWLAVASGSLVWWTVIDSE